MSSELENVKNQVQQAASTIDDAAQATQTAYSNTDTKKERLNAMGQYASSQGLEQACEKLLAAFEALGTANGEATKATTQLQSVESTIPIPEALPKLSSAVSELGTSTTSLAGAAELVGNAKTDAANVGVDGIVAVCQGAMDMIDIARSTLVTASNSVGEYQKRLEQEARELTALSAGATGDRPLSTLATDGILHGTKQRRAGVLEGPVVFSAPDGGATRTEAGQAKEYIDAGNKALSEGQLSPSGRVSLDLKAKKAKSKAAARERKRAQDANEPYGSDVAAHLPDSTWVGKPEPPGGWGRHTNRVNASIGSQSAQYPVGYRPTLFQIDDTWPELPQNTEAGP